MITPRFPRAHFRDMCLEIIGQGAYGQHQNMAELDATIATVDAVAIYLYGEHVKRDDIRDYLRNLHEAESLERAMPQSYDPHAEHVEWDRMKDAAEYAVDRIGWRIVGGCGTP